MFICQLCGWHYALTWRELSRVETVQVTPIESEVLIYRNNSTGVQRSPHSSRIQRYGLTKNSVSWSNENKCCYFIYCVLNLRKKHKKSHVNSLSLLRHKKSSKQHKHLLITSWAYQSAIKVNKQNIVTLSAGYYLSIDITAITAK